jgi:chorismate mutase
MNSVLAPFREKIDSLDNKIVELLVQRERIIREVADLKADQNIPAVLQDRVDEVRERARAQAKEAGTDGEYVAEIYRKIISLSCAIEEEVAAMPENRADHK